MGFRLAYLDLTLVYSKGQLGRRNGVSSHICWPSTFYFAQLGRRKGVPLNSVAFLSK